MDKIVAYVCKATPLNNTKELTHNMDKIQNNYAEGKKPDQKQYILVLPLIHNSRKFKLIYRDKKMSNFWDWK